MNKAHKLGTVTFTIVVFLFVASYFFAMLLGPALFYITSAGLDFGLRETKPPILLFLFFGFYFPVPLNAGRFFLFLWGIFLLCFLAAWRLRERFHDVVSKAFSRPFNRLFSNWLFAMPIVASTLLAGVSLIIYFQDLFGVPTGGIPIPKTDTEYFDLYLSLSYASIIEEIGFRIIPIGTFLLARLLLIQSVRSAAIVSFRKRIKLFLYSFLYPDKAKRILGVKNVVANGIRAGISQGEWIMLFLTSLIFGAAHLFSGIGWEAGKITSTFLQGFVFGAAYLSYGLEAPILLHWFFNYYFYAYELGSQYYANMPSSSFWIENINLTLGGIGLIALTVWGLMKISKRWETMAKKPSELSP